MHSAEATAPQTRLDNEITKLADDVYLFRHQFHQAILNTTPQGVIVTDPITANVAVWLKTEIKKLTDQPVRYVIYRHHHNDHITGGSVFAEHAPFVSHALARANIPQAADPATPVPSLTFTDRLSIDLDSTHVKLIYTGKNHVRMFRGYFEDLRATVLEHMTQSSSVEETKKTGHRPVVTRLDPIFKALAPGRGDVERIKGRDRMEGTAEEAGKTRSVLTYWYRGVRYRPVLGYNLSIDQEREAALQVITAIHANTAKLERLPAQTTHFADQSDTTFSAFILIYLQYLKAKRPTNDGRNELILTKHIIPISDRKDSQRFALKTDWPIWKNVGRILQAQAITVDQLRQGRSSENVRC